MARSKKYKDVLIESLRDSKEAVAYLNAVLEECSGGDEESQKILLQAFKDVVEAQGGVSALAKKTGFGRESLYKTLSSRGNPKLSTLTILVSAMGFDLRVCLPGKR